jgi:hypothetical protein
LKQLDLSQEALWSGILFSLVFTATIWIAGDRLAQIPKLSDQDASWYYGKLPQPNLWSRATARGFYLAHQFAIWGLIGLGLNLADRFRSSQSTQRSRHSLRRAGAKV